MSGPWEKYQAKESGPWEKYAGQLEAGRPEPFRPGGETIGEFIKQEAQSRSLPAQIVAGSGTALDNAAFRLKQVFAGLTPEDEARVKANRSLTDSAAGMIGNIGGTMAVGAPAIGGQAALASLAARVLPAAISPTVAAGATGAALAAGTNPVLTGESEAQNALIGAAGGAAGDVAARGLAMVAQPLTQSPAVQKLLSEGVVPTPGQASGPRSIINRVEQQLTSMGPLGWLIQNARDRAVKEVDVAALKRAIPGGESAAGLKAGRESIERVGEMLDNAYSSAYSGIKGKITYDSKFTDALKGIPKAEGVDLPPSLEDRFKQLIKDRVISRIEDGASAEAIRDAHNSLGALARKYRASGDLDQRALGEAFSRAKGSFREMVSRQSSGDFKAAMDALDKNYSAFLTVEKAAGYQGAREGVFSAPMLNRAAQSKGSAEMRSFAQTANDVLGNTVPDSGTVGRAFWPYIAGGGIGAANEGLGGPGWLTAAALAPAMYSRPGARYMLGDLIPGQATAASFLRSTAPYTSILGMGIGSQQR